MTERSRIGSAIRLAPILVAGLLAGFGCNESIDDPETSEAQVVVSGADPLTACVDYDGVPKDIDGDGTEEQVFFDVEQEIQFQSRTRGTSGAGKFQDAILSSVTIRYELSTGVNPAARTEAVTITVPADGTASEFITTVLASDIIAGFFGPPGVTGNILLTFTGKDAGGEPVTATGQVPVISVATCEGT